MNKTFETTKDGVNSATNEINYILKKAAHLSDLKKGKKYTKKKIPKNLKWFDLDCKALRNNLDNNQI